MFDMLDYTSYIRYLDEGPSKYKLQVGRHNHSKLLEMPEKYYHWTVKIEGSSGGEEETRCFLMMLSF